MFTPKPTYYCTLVEKKVKVISWNGDFCMCVVELPNGIYIAVHKDTIVKEEVANEVQS